MAKIYIKFPTKFFDTKEWQKPRKYTKTEAYLWLLNNQSTISVRHLATSWQWSKSQVERFIAELKAQKLWDTFWDTFRDTKYVENKQDTNLNGTRVGTPFGTHLIENIINPPILSSTKVESNIIPPKGENKNINLGFIKFQEWILENAPRVAKMKEPFTEIQYFAIKRDFDTTFICDLLMKMHNYEPLLTKNRNANLTFRNWAKRQHSYDKHTSTNQAGNAEPDDLLRAVAEGISRAYTPQEWQS
jgi:hypothetical protein